MATTDDSSTRLRRRLARVSAPSVPAGIYGTIICASILAAAGEKSAAKVAATVLVTLFAYWLAERYAEVLGLAAGPDGPGPPITMAHVRHVLRSGWSMIQASITPLLVMLVSRLFGASSALAVDIALVYAVVLLVLLGWLAASRAGLRRWPRVGATAFAAFLGLLVVVLKASLH